MTMGERIELIITDRQIKKVEFAAALDINQSYVTKLIKNEREPSTRLIDAICREFGVRREWLETGLGEMYTQRNSGIVKQLSAELNLDAKSVEFLENFLQLTAANRQLVIAGLEQAAKLFPRKPDDELTPDERAEVVRQERIDELAAEKRGTQTSSASTGTNGTSKKIGNGS